MIIQPLEKKPGSPLLAIDSNGLYLTTPDRVGTNMADTNRYAVGRTGLADRLSALGLDPAELLEQNRHRIRVEGGEAKKKVNPLKASKRGMKGK